MNFNIIVFISVGIILAIVWKFVLKKDHNPTSDSSNQQKSIIPQQNLENPSSNKSEFEKKAFINCWGTAGMYNFNTIV